MRIRIMGVFLRSLSILKNINGMDRTIFKYLNVLINHEVTNKYCNLNASKFP